MLISVEPKIIAMVRLMRLSVKRKGAEPMAAHRGRVLGKVVVCDLGLTTAFFHGNILVNRIELLFGIELFVQTLLRVPSPAILEIVPAYRLDGLRYLILMGNKNARKGGEAVLAP